MVDGNALKEMGADYGKGGFEIMELSAGKQAVDVDVLDDEAVEKTQTG